ncbi:MULTISPECIES: sigma-70 family RNA polymerase sigma factor [unclassified Mucilaginibacter]|uniref:sigma-70 family RNA polymerase sigma factor n=1 Tax=unclassified Mucilaginibacter TaxID=2617802 RepID=UPI002AC926EB|nr:MULTISPECIES: sigma-70 family RNA polymerase sigma factor [unclassified Mucilaginibacter]MEB0260294.1 sigma-70 family RNA polymerase sigma factor [Mucilaginibacter sp. 10I4]MEB0277295.1 sigma-70 family RNA polymerase sigma factor [Mucilaginibacter sp. 10B2]MEB0302145.1 sigma-70 family RNA polymerase sigma factor [Mucilaginibacter sp. 5C4]WPX25421.1 sigma-70 family RNA polymerase sigma factor [Mucilaginibacter sp. 5C4]
MQFNRWILQMIVNTTQLIESWVTLYTNNLYSWAFFKTSSKESAEDLVQDTFLTAYQQFEKFRGESTPKTWLLAILNNKIRAHYRKKYQQLAEKERSETSNSPIFDQLFDENDRWKNKEKPSAWHDDEGHLLDDREFNGVLTSCLGKLPEQWRVAVNLKYIEQKKGDLICQELDIAATNFWQILHRAKLQLRKCLEINWFKV